MTTPTPKDNPPFDPPVFCSGIERDCKHGQLARSCNICELERDLAAAQEAITQCRTLYNETIQRVVAAEADAESNRKDAERYRWLRGNGAIISRAAGIPVHLAHFGIGLDAAIDAAIAGEPS